MGWFCAGAGLQPKRQPTPKSRASVQVTACPGEAPQAFQLQVGRLNTVSGAAFPGPSRAVSPQHATASLCNSRPLPLALCLFLAGCNFSRPHGFSDCQGAPAKEQGGLAAPRSCLEAGSWCSRLCRLLQRWRCPAAPHGSLCCWVASAQSCPQSLSHLCLHPAHSLRAPGGQIELWGNLVGLFESSRKPPYRGTFPIPS